MEALSAVVLVANLLAVLDNSFKVANLVRKVGQDSRPDGLYVRLVTERARYAEWKRRMGVETDEDLKTLGSKLPEDARKNLPIVLAPMERYSDLTERLFVKYGVAAPDRAESPRSLKDKMRRVNLLMDGHRELNNLLETLKNCNDGLLTIAPPAPGYYVSLAGNDPILETADEAPSVSDRSRGMQSRAQPVSSTSSHRRQEIASAQSSQPLPSLSSQQSSEKVFHPVIELLHLTCLTAVKLITERHQKYRMEFQDIGDRLQLWGTSLFQGRISIDQALNQKSEAVKLLKENIAGSLADIAIALTHTLSLLGEPEDSSSVLRLREVFSIPEISLLPVSDLHESPAGVDVCLENLTDLVECLFMTLSTTEMVMIESLTRLKETTSAEERDLVLVKSKSDVSLPNLQPGPAHDLLKIDLELIAAMQASLEDSKYAKYMEHKNRKFDAVQMYKDLGEEARQMKYWANHLANTTDDQKMTSETQTAMMLNLSNIARTFEAGFKSDKVGKDLSRDLDTILSQCSAQFPEIKELLSTPAPETDAHDSLDILRSSNVEMRKLANSKTPDMKYKKDFGFKEKATLAAAEGSGMRLV